MHSFEISASATDRRQPRWRAWLLLAPMLVWLVAFVVVPTAILLVYSFASGMRWAG